jgi:hypothetical protein
MDQVLPGLNNVARHIRPFVVVAWSWRRARQLAEAQQLHEVPVDTLRDFVDRIEVIYAWSQFLRDPNADLPGRLVLADLLSSRRWTFGGPAWQKRRRERRYSTAFTAPVNYGPGLRMLGWVQSHPKYPSVLIPTPEVASALDAFESLIVDRLSHPAFSEFGSVEVTAEEAAAWADAWAIGETTEAERRTMNELLFGSGAPIARRMGGALMLRAAEYASTIDVGRVRTAMAGAPSGFVVPAELDEICGAWRRAQVRQLFRLSLESLLYWIIGALDDGPKTTSVLVDRFLSRISGRSQNGNASEWLNWGDVDLIGPTELMGRIEDALGDSASTDLASRTADGLAFCLKKEAPESDLDFERVDRLPLFRARREAAAWAAQPATDFVRHVLESWVLAQHTYWSIGRGLADARARGKTLLRLKVILDEGGWTLAPGASRGSPPIPTPDRLQTALTLAGECGLLSARAE